MKRWIIFFKATNPDGSTFVFPGPYEGNEILWSYLFEDIIEELELKELEVLGYIEATYDQIMKIFPTLEDSND